MVAAEHVHGEHCHHHGHTHEISDDADFQKLSIVLSLLVGFTAIECVVGFVAHSLALLSDAGHMLTDALAIGLSMWAIRLTQRPTVGDMTYGLGRAKILSALLNGLTMAGLACFITFESIMRLIDPPEVRGSLVLYVALFGVAVNLLAVRTLATANRDDLNVEGSFQHILTDMYAFIGTAFAGFIILKTGFDRIDLVVSLLVAFLMIKSAVPLIVKSIRIFLQIAPAGMEAQVRRAIEEYPGVRAVGELHIWTLCSDNHHLSAHVTITSEDSTGHTCTALNSMLSDSFKIRHSTLQVDGIAEQQP